MTGPAWLAPGVAALMLLIAASCAARLLICKRRGRATEPDADGLHVVMGVAMAGMLEPPLSPVPGTVWQAVFAAGAAWFGWQTIRARGRRPGSWQCGHPAPHAVECAAMLYMLLPARSAGHALAMAMPGMSAATGGNPAIALVLALFMVGYIVWTTDRLARLSRIQSVAAGPVHAGARPAQAILGPATVTSSSQMPKPPAAIRQGAATAALAPRFAACYKIAMGFGMGYMLIMML